MCRFWHNLSFCWQDLSQLLHCFFLAEIYAKFFISELKDKGVFVQGVFRSNMAIVSLATVFNAYGSEGLGVGAIYMGVITIFI